MTYDTLHDERQSGFYIIDNYVVENYGQTIGVYGLGVYNVLAMYANKNGKNIFPSYKTIAEKLGISRLKVIQSINGLVEAGLITKRKRLDEAGDSTSNAYTLVSVRGGICGEPPSISSEPPSISSEPQVVYDVNHGGIPRIPDQYPINNTQLNNSSASQNTSTNEHNKPPEKPKRSKKEPTPPHPLTKPIMDAYLEVRGKKGVFYTKESAWAKKIAEEGGTPEEVKGCYLWKKKEPFWATNVLGLAKIYELLPSYRDRLPKTKPQSSRVVNNASEGYRIVPNEMWAA